ncbi:MAG: ABC transporter permease [Chlorobiales bacterium]|nr:ABC transporter permease [Chlorobiales bacterium]
MKFEFIVARRFAFPKSAAASRKPTFISVIATVGIMLGTAALILTLSIVQGFSQEIKAKLIGFGAHIRITDMGGRTFPSQFSDIKAVQIFPNIEAASPFLQTEVILKIQSQSGEVLIEPAILKGISPEHDVSFIRQKVVQGRFISATDSVKGQADSDDFKMIIGKKLAHKLGVEVGNRLVVIASGDHIAPEMFSKEASLDKALSMLRVGTAEVVGIYETGMAQGFDDAMIFAGLEETQRFLKIPNQISGYDAKTKDIEQVEQTAINLNHELGYPFMARSIFDVYYNIFAWLRLQENIIPLLLVTVTIVAGFNIISTLLIIVLDKRREVGVLLSIGTTARSIKLIFVSQSVIMAAIGIGLGNLIAFTLSMLEKTFHLIPLSEETYFISNVPISMNPLNYITVSVIAIIVCLLASLIPAKLAAGLQPVEAIQA